MWKKLIFSFPVMEVKNPFSSIVQSTSDEKWYTDNDWIYRINMLPGSCLPKRADTTLAPIPFFRLRSSKTFAGERKKLRCMILHDHEIIWAKIRCCNACTKLKQSVRHPCFAPFHFDPQKDVVLISLKRCDMVGVGLRALRKEENESIYKKNF